MRHGTGELTQQEDPLVGTSVRLGCAMAADEDAAAKQIIATAATTAVFHTPTPANDRANRLSAKAEFARIQAAKGQALANAHAQRVGKPVHAVRSARCSV